MDYQFLSVHRCSWIGLFATRNDADIMPFYNIKKNYWSTNNDCVTLVNDTINSWIEIEI